VEHSISRSLAERYDVIASCFGRRGKRLSVQAIVELCKNNRLRIKKARELEALLMYNRLN